MINEYRAALKDANRIRIGTKVAHGLVATVVIVCGLILLPMNLISLRPYLGGVLVSMLPITWIFLLVLDGSKYARPYREYEELAMGKEYSDTGVITEMVLERLDFVKMGLLLNQKDLSSMEKLAAKSNLDIDLRSYLRGGY